MGLPKKDLSLIVRKRSIPGVFIFNREMQMLHSNSCAGAMVGPPDGAQFLDAAHPLMEAIFRLVERMGGEPKNPLERRRQGSLLLETPEGVLSVRAFHLKPSQRQQHDQLIAVLVEKVIEKRTVNLDKAGDDYALSPREVEVVGYICAGFANREIAARMFIAQYTVKDHIKKIMKKTGAKTRGEIVALLVGA